jgi:DNA-binding transcriptional MerR regulator
VIEGMHQIGEVAEAVGLSLRTIRHYEEVGLVPPSGRSAGGFRLYTDGDIERLGLVKQMKPLDFSLDEMRELLELRDRLADRAGDRDHAELVERLELFATAAERRCEALREQLDAAQAMAQTLRREVRRHRQTVRR